jgi:Tfp pilus assembly protein PilF
VVMEDGSPPPKTVGLERLCSDENQGSEPGPITNKKGEYTWRMIMDRGSTRVCKIHAVLPGYQSTQFDVTGSFITENFHNANSVVTIPPLTLVATVHDPKVLVISDAGVPAKSLKPWKAAMKALDAKDYAEADRQLQEAMSLSPKYAPGWNTLGLVYGNEKKLDQSRDAFQHAIESDPKFLPPYVSLDRLCIRMKDWQCAVKDTDDLLAVDVKKLYTAEAYMHQAAARLELKDLPGAEMSIEASLRLDPAHKNPRAEYVMARILEAKGDFSGASEHVVRYLQLAPTAADAELIRAHLQIMGTPAAAGAAQPDLELF